MISIASRCYSNRSLTALCRAGQIVVISIASRCYSNIPPPYVRSEGWLGRDLYSVTMLFQLNDSDAWAILLE